MQDNVLTLGENSFSCKFNFQIFVHLKVAAGKWKILKNVTAASDTNKIAEFLRHFWRLTKNAQCP